MANYAILTLDLTPPLVSDLSPEDGSQDVSVAIPLSFSLSDVLGGVDIASLGLTIAGEQAIADGVFQSGYAGEINQNGGIYTVSVTKDDNWPGLTGIVYEIHIQDTVGNDLIFQGNFYTSGNYTDFTGEWVNLGEDETVLKGQLRRFLKLISFALDEAKGLVDAFPVILNVDKTDADYLPLIAALVGIDFNYDIPIPRQREEIKRAVEVYKTKGTIPGIKRFCRNIMGVNPEIAEWPKRIMMLNNPSHILPRITTPGALDNTGLAFDQGYYLLDFSDYGDYRFDKFGIYFQLAQYAGIPNAEAEKILRLLPENIPASTEAKLIFVDAAYQFGSADDLSNETFYHALGTGDPSWDIDLPFPPSGQTKLINEIHRRKPDSIVFVDAEGWVTTTPTSRLRMVSILRKNEPELDGQFIREQGLFAGDASKEKDSGALIGVINHQRQWKTTGCRIIKTLELAHDLAFIVDESGNFVVYGNDQFVVG